MLLPALEILEVVSVARDVGLLLREKVLTV